MSTEASIIYLDPDKYLDILSIGEFIELVAQTMEHGYGKVTFDVTVQEGKVKTVSLTKQVTMRVANEEKKGVT